MADAGEGPSVVKKDDSALALSILFVAIVIVIAGFIYYFRTKKANSDSVKQSSSFTPPGERAEYISAKETLNVSKVSDLDQLKKLLMRRAMKTIPILLSLQNEGSSIERLYKRGMLTDDMHFKVKELKAFVDKEFADIQAEAEDLVEGWGTHIWPQAMQFHQMIQKQTDAKLEEQKQAEENKRKAEKEAQKEQKAIRVPREVKPVEAMSLNDAETNKADEADKLAKKVLDEEDKDQPSSASKKKANKKK